MAINNVAEECVHHCTGDTGILRDFPGHNLVSGLHSSIRLITGRLASGRLPTMQILVLIGTVGASPHRGEILPPCDFF